MIRMDAELSREAMPLGAVPDRNTAAARPRRLRSVGFALLATVGLILGVMAGVVLAISAGLIELC